MVGKQRRLVPAVFTARGNTLPSTTSRTQHGRGSVAIPSQMGTRVLRPCRRPTAPARPGLAADPSGTGTRRESTRRGGGLPGSGRWRSTRWSPASFATSADSGRSLPGSARPMCSRCCFPPNPPRNAPSYAAGPMRSRRWMASGSWGSWMRTCNRVRQDGSFVPSPTVTPVRQGPAWWGKAIQVEGAATIASVDRLNDDTVRGKCDGDG